MSNGKDEEQPIMEDHDGKPKGDSHLTNHDSSSSQLQEVNAKNEDVMEQIRSRKRPFHVETLMARDSYIPSSFTSSPSKRVISSCSQTEAKQTSDQYTETDGLFNYPTSLPLPIFLPPVGLASYSTFPNQLHFAEYCTICQDVATGLHYGVKTCDGCKAFFRRSVLAKIKYNCATQDCVIDLVSRNKCQYCRYKKCISSGMNRMLVQNLKGRITRSKEESKEKSKEESKEDEK